MPYLLGYGCEIQNPCKKAGDFKRLMPTHRTTVFTEPLCRAVSSKDENGGFFRAPLVSSFLLNPIAWSKLLPI